MIPLKMAGSSENSSTCETPDSIPTDDTLVDPLLKFGVSEAASLNHSALGGHLEPWESHLLESHWRQIDALGTAEEAREGHQQPPFETDLTFLHSDASVRGGNGKGPGGSDGGGGSSGDILSGYVSGSADGTDGYDIQIAFKGSGWTVELQQAFIDAADYFTTVITDDIGGGVRYHGTTIDDLYVTAELSAIDGIGGILGQAGPSAVWTESELTATGAMQFDAADANAYSAKGLWDDIVTHEMMHVLGFGSLWDYGTHALVSDNQYIGEAALDAYREAEDDPTLSYIPLEDQGGAGTAGSHWSEAVLDNELMTGYINDDGNAATNDDNYLSKFSVMSLEDLGYVVSYVDYPHDDILIS